MQRDEEGNRLGKDDICFLSRPSLSAVFDALEAAGGEVRVAGGAVRNILLRESVGDIDLCTTLKPTETVRALEKAGLQAVPTGLEHGTVTAVSDGAAYEVTTLREDVETDGRRAKVKFGTDWEADARRRDLTINALYCDRHGQLYDPLNGMEDIRNRTIRFIGAAQDRIKEDYLRILRFFRFFAWYGKGRPDGEGLKACAALKDGLKQISAERVHVELIKLLRADDPYRAVLWMRTTGVLTLILPESEKWGIDLLPHLIAAEERFSIVPDPLIRLEAMIPPDEERVVEMARRLRMPNYSRKRLLNWAMIAKDPTGGDRHRLRVLIYRDQRQAALDNLTLELAKRLMKGVPEPELEKAHELLEFALKSEPKQFPVAGQDLIQAGLPEGVELGKKLRELENRWIDSGFTLTKRQLLAGLQKT